MTLERIAVSGYRSLRLRLGFGGSELSYAIELGYPAEACSAFHLDPQIKRE